MTQYGLIAALVALALLAVLSTVGVSLETVFCKVNAGFHPLTATTCMEVRK